MAPKKDVPEGGHTTLLTGFTVRETKFLAAAFVSSIGKDKYDWELMSSLTGNTSNTAKKIFPPIKKKAAEAHPSFAAFLGHDDAVATASNSAANTASADAVPEAKHDTRKRKTADESPESDTIHVKGVEPLADKIARADKEVAAVKKKLAETKASIANKVAADNKAPAEKKKRGRPRKQIKTEEVDDDLGKFSPHPQTR
ncbi:hypothetical protein BDW02DRAFT_596973 [Decorospora gaudefroyi]|uniref:Uncharacterized protein n=1 Tax=Decorospora gaudefroyi TaxID=184978 RepID=A0A6A5KQG4_9PLEO|nr:hypothetical protein BDW02DRAFT_596973 [Decorospora gaudefroyi]